MKRILWGATYISKGKRRDAYGREPPAERSLNEGTGNDLTEKDRDFCLRFGQTMRLEGPKYQANPMLLMASLVSPRICVEKVNPGMT